MISTENVVVWRLQTKAGNGHIGEYCIKKGVIAMGWCYIDNSGEKTRGKVFKKYDDYVRWYEDVNGEGSVGDSVSRLVFDVKKDDLVFCLFDIDETPRTVGLVDTEGMITGAYTALKVNQSIALPEYVYCYYLCVDVSDDLLLLHSQKRGCRYGNCYEDL